MITDDVSGPVTPSTFSSLQFRPYRLIWISGLIINIGTGNETSVQELYDAIARVTGYQQAPRNAPARPGELQRSALDPGRAEIHLGWKPWTDLDTGVERTLEWFQARAGR